MTHDLGEMTVQHDLSEAVPVLRLRGDIDLATHPTVEVALHALLAGGRGLVVVDLTEVGFVGSCGLVLLVGARERADLAGRRLLVVGCNPAVLRALEVTGLRRAVDPHPTTADALAELIDIPTQRTR